MGAMSVPDPTLLGTIIGSLPDAATMLATGTSSDHSTTTTSATSTTTTTADGPASDLTRGESETVLGPSAKHAAPRRDDD
jgi:hypothetical protein